MSSIARSMKRFGFGPILLTNACATFLNLLMSLSLPDDLTAGGCTAEGSVCVVGPQCIVHTRPGEHVQHQPNGGDQNQPYRQNNEDL